MNEVKPLLSNFFSRLASWVYPSKCPTCKALSDLIPCNMCRQDFHRAEIRLIEPVPFIDEVRAFYVYRDEQSAKLVRAYKYRRETALERYMSGCLLDLYIEWDPDEDSIVPVPIHRSRLAMRGFNQALSLCSLLPQHKLNGHLMRIRRTKPQVELTPEQRAVNLIGAFQCSTDLSGQRILLVDDVFTTGATASECAKSLKRSGATWVGVLCFAAKP